MQEALHPPCFRVRKELYETTRCILMYKPHSFSNIIAIVNLLFLGKMILRRETTSIDSLSTNPLSPNALTSVVPQMIVNRRLQLQCVIGSPRLCLLFLSLMLLKTGNVLIMWPLAKVKNFVGMAHTNTPSSIFLCILLWMQCMACVSLCTIYLLILSLFLADLQFSEFHIPSDVTNNECVTCKIDKLGCLITDFHRVTYLVSCKLINLCCWIHQFWY